MRAAEFDVRERDPFESAVAIVATDRMTPPIVSRIRALWERRAGTRSSPRSPHPQGRPSPATPTWPMSPRHTPATPTTRSRSRGTPSAWGRKLIERVRSRGWNPDSDARDRDDKDALAARGYWQAFQSVKQDVSAVLAGAPAGELVGQTHHDWYRQLFQPFVAAGALPASALAGYRTIPVYLRGSRYVPPRWDAVRDAMPRVPLLASEPEPAVRAVLGHWLIG